MNAFNDFYSTATTHITFKQSFNNGTGYFNGLVRETLAENLIATTLDGFNRKLIIVGAGENGCSVIFQRYTNHDGIFILQNAKYSEPISLDEIETIFQSIDKNAAITEFFKVKKPPSVEVNAADDTSTINTTMENNIMQVKKATLKSKALKAALWVGGAVAVTGGAFYAWKALKGGVSVADVTDTIESAVQTVANLKK